MILGLIPGDWQLLQHTPANRRHLSPHQGLALEGILSSYEQHPPKPKPMGSGEE